MMKVTREIAQQSLENVRKKGYITGGSDLNDTFDWNIIVTYINDLSQPQASDDVKRDLKQILYTLKYASKSREQLPREVFTIDNENIGKPDYMAYKGIEQHIQAQASEIERLKKLIKEERK